MYGLPLLHIVIQTSFSIFSLSMARRKWIDTSIFLLITTLVSCCRAEIPNYHDHCNFMVPESTPTAPEFATIPFAPDQDGYYLGGNGMFIHTNSSGYSYSSNDRQVLLFRTHHVHRTTADDVYKVEASLILRPSSMAYFVEDVRYSYSHSPQVISTWSDRGYLSFKVEGFWSKSTGKLCMVGSSSTDMQEGKARILNPLLKLHDVKSVNNITSLIGGTMESLNTADDSTYFEPISFLMFPRMNYEYTEVSKELDSVCTGETDAAKSSLSLPLSKSICSVFSRWSNSFQLLYSKGCDSAKNCNPLVEDVGYLPQIVSMVLLQCANDSPRLRFLLQFSNSSYYYLPFSPNTTFVAEGSWNAKKNQLCVVGCRLSAADSFNGSTVKDCSIRMSLSFPSVWSVRNTRGITGHIWSNQAKNGSGYFERIKFQSSGSEMHGIPGLKYNYTLVGTARKSCPEKQPRSKKKIQYPDANSYDMQFDMAVKNSSGKRIGWGYATPIFVGDQIAKLNTYSPANSPSEATTHPIKPLNISYKMNFPSLNASLNEYIQVEIYAEGIYDPETGEMCMVGCRYLDSDDQISRSDLMDCHILVNIQFPTTDSNSYIHGNIKSKRDNSDPLYLEPLSFSAVSYYSRRARQSIWRMDLETVMVLVSNTLVCVFVGCQIRNVKKHPNVFPLVSLLMLVLLTLGLMIPLVLNFEALFFSKQNRQYSLRSAGGWVEVEEVIVRVVTMVAFLLQVRLLQLVSSTRFADENQKAAWSAERKTLYVALPLYIVGASIALSVNWKNYKFGDRMNYTYSNNQQHSLWMDLRSYAGLVLDGFLLPQILLNIFHNARENVLSRFFYMGITLVRLVPHAYDLYRAHYYADDFDWSYMYADPAADYYSTTWDVIIPLGGLLFAAIIYLQQHNGGRFFLQNRFMELQQYEKIPVANEP